MAPRPESTLSTFSRIADLSLTVEGYRLEGLVHRVSGNFERHTTVVRLRGLGVEGVGEDVTYDSNDQRVFQREGGDLPLAGRFTLAEFSERLEDLDLYPTPPQPHTVRQYRRWAVESAALDLALRQAGRSLPQALEIEPRQLRIVASIGLGKPPSVKTIGRWHEPYPELCFKLDATGAWDDALAAELAATGSVDTLDLKGAYRGTPVDQAADVDLYRRVAETFPDAWIEDPAWTPETEALLARNRDRITWDAPIHSVDDIRGLPDEPRMLNFKPSRFGALETLFDAYDHCRERGIDGYGGGQFELGPGRGQIQLLAALFHPDGPNDVAPTGYNDPTPRPGLERSPCVPGPSRTGFRRDAPGRGVNDDGNAEP
jgi:hypothetical protein